MTANRKQFSCEDQNESAEKANLGGSVYHSLARTRLEGVCHGGRDGQIGGTNLPEPGRRGIAWHGIVQSY
jgi:hypothetical protein